MDINLEYIPMDKIVRNESNSAIFKVSEIEHLAKIIEEEGFSTPIEVYKLKNGKYEISSGHRRYEAMKLLKRKEIPCIVSKDSTDNIKIKKLISSNIATRQLTPMEMAKAIEKYKEILEAEKFPTDKRQKIAEYFNISPSNVYRYECLLKLIPELQNLADMPQFPYSAFQKASNLTKKEQEKLYAALQELEREERNIGNEEPIDITEIKLTRIRIEQIINSILLNKEKKKKEEAVISDKISDTVETIEKIENSKTNLSDTNSFNNIEILEKPKDSVIINLDKEKKNDDYEDSEVSQLLNFYERELTRIREREYRIKNKKEIAKKISDLKKILEEIEEKL